MVGSILLLLAVIAGLTLLAHSDDPSAEGSTEEPSPAKETESTAQEQASGLVAASNANPADHEDTPSSAIVDDIQTNGTARTTSSPPSPSPLMRVQARSPGSPFLTGPSDGAPIEIVRTYLKDNQSDLGLRNNDVDDALVTDNYTTKHNGVTHIYLRQEFGGLEVVNADININVTKDGSIMNMGNTFVPDLADVIQATDPTLTPIEAAYVALDYLHLEADQPLSVVEMIGGASQETMVSASGVSQKDIPVHLEYYVEPNGEVALVWALDIYTTDSLHYWQMKVDAITGELVGRADQVVNEVYTIYPEPLSNPADGFRSFRTDPYTNSPSLASPYGWHDTNGIVGAEFTITRGNNVHAYEDSSDANASLGNEPDGGASIIFAPTINLNADPSTYTDSSVVNLFYWNNLLHDIHYEYGFDEASGNFQVNNYGNGGTGGDDVIAEAQDGGGFNNANMLTLVDGTNSRMQMYLGNKASPLRDGSFDNEVIIHEYGHGISKRLTGGPNNVFVLFFDQSGGMGEGWGDFWALVLTAEASDINTQARPIGTWLFGQAPDGPGLRQYPYSTDMALNPHTYEDIDGVSVPHGVGSIWCAVLWEMYWNLVDAHGFDPDFYGGTGGNNIALQLVMDGLKLQPAGPTFLDARDAILLADEVNNGGANYLLIWQAFAKRGMGLSADDGGTQNTLDVTEAFDVPDDLQILPAKGFSPAGQEGGPFMPPQMLFQVSNVGTATISWTATTDADWLDLSHTVGAVTTNGMIDVGVSLNTFADTLTRGVHIGPVVFSNTLNGVTQIRNVELEIGAEFFFAEPMNALPSPAWTRNDGGHWHFGQPLGLDGDPSSGFTGDNVYGNFLDGNYSSGNSWTFLKTATIDCSGYLNVELTFQRWLGVAFDEAELEVSNDHVEWTAFWTYDRAVLHDDGEWKQVSYDISSVADGESTVYVRWGIAPENNPVSYGWNIDDVSLKGIPLPPLPVDHFEWDPVAPVQHVEGAIPVTLTARDIHEETVPSYSDSVDVSGFSVLLSDNFEDGNYDGWTNGSGSYVSDVTNATAAGGDYSLTLIGGDGQVNDGLYYTLPDSTPERIEFHVRSASTEATDAFFMILDSNSSVIAFLYASNGGEMSVDVDPAIHSAPYVANQWYKITWIIDWGAQTLDYYRDDILIADDVPFLDSASSLSRVVLFNLEDSQAWWDDIQLLDSIPLTVSPSTDISLTAGTWAGLVTVHQEATDVFLRADDGTVLVGDSVMFDVIDEGTIGARRSNALLLDKSIFKHGKTALQNLNFDITTVTETTPFQNLLNSSTWDLVVVDSRFSMPASVALDVEDYVAAGGRILLQFNDLDGSAGNTAPAALSSAFGIASDTDFSSPLDIYPWDAEHPIFNTPHSVGTLMPNGPDTTSDNGDRVEPDVGATALAGFVSTVTSGQGAIILANNGRTLYNAFMADDMSNVVELLENEILFLAGGNPPNVLLISDTSELTDVGPFLAADGHLVTRITNEFANGSANLTNLTFLQTFDMIIWGASGAGSGNLHDSAVHATLENYIQAGGHLLVTGADTLASPEDTNMANLVRSTTTTNISATSFTTASLNHFILNGPAGDFRNTVVTPGYATWDGATADTGAGAISLATVDGQSFDAIIYTDIPTGGSVGYWTGGELGASARDGKTEWKTPSDSLDILRNWIFGVLGARTDLALYMSSSQEPTRLWQPVVYTISVVNNGPNEATGVRVTDIVPTKLLVDSIQSSQGSYSNAGGMIVFDVGTVPSLGSATITLGLAPLTYDTFTNRASLLSDQYDSAGFNNDASKVSTVIPGVDGDFDGIHDWWELEYHAFLETMDATTDLDGDEMMDLEEWIALSDADDPNSAFTIYPDIDTTGQSVLYWDSAPGREYDIYWSASLFDTFQLLGIDIPFPQNTYTDTVHLAEQKSFYKAVAHLEREKSLTVGIYDFAKGQGNNDQQASIYAAGHSHLHVSSLNASTPSTLSRMDIFYVQNPFSTSNSAEYLSQITNIQHAVSNGMSLILHDRAGVALGSTPIMPGGESIPLVYAPSGDINLASNGHAHRVANGVGGMLYDTTLDSATHSAQGYALESTLPDGAIPILSQTDPTHISTFAYPYGEGWVIYSTIALDFYLAGGGTVPAFTNIYAPNIVDYGAFLAHESP